MPPCDAPGNPPGSTQLAPHVTSAVTVRAVVTTIAPAHGSVIVGDPAPTMDDTGPAAS